MRLARIDLPENALAITPVRVPDEKLKRLVARARVAGHPVVTTSWVLNYLSADRQAAFVDELDRIAHEYMVDHGAYPSTLGYKGYPKSCCTSLNEIICHGIPDDRVLLDGDIVNCDVTIFLDGVHGDTNATFLVGEGRPSHPMNRCAVVQLEQGASFRPFLHHARGPEKSPFQITSPPGS